MLKTKTQLGHVGIDIGSHAIKIAQVEKTETGFRIVDAAIVPRRKAWEFENWQTCPEMPSALEITAARKLTSLNGTAAAVTTTMALCDIRKIAVAEHDDTFVRNEIKYELENVDRFAGQQRVFDYWNVPKPWSHNDGEIYVYSLKNSWAKQVANDVSHAKLRFKLLDGLPMALARATSVAYTDIPANQTVATLDLGLTRATFSVIQNGQPVFTRILRECGFHQVIKTIRNELGLSKGQAHVLFSEASSLDNRSQTRLQRYIQPAVQPFMARLTDELGRTLQFIDRFNTPRPQQLVLFGAGSTLEDLSQHIAHATNLESELWSLPAGLAVDNKGLEINLLGPAAAMSCLAWS